MLIAVVVESCLLLTIPQIMMMKISAVVDQHQHPKCSQQLFRCRDAVDSSVSVYIIIAWHSGSKLSYSYNLLGLI